MAENSEMVVLEGISVDGEIPPLLCEGEGDGTELL
jgi:hypothetical protein